MACNALRSPTLSAQVRRATRQSYRRNLLDMYFYSWHSQHAPWMVRCRALALSTASIQKHQQCATHTQQLSRICNDARAFQYLLPVTYHGIQATDTHLFPSRSEIAEVRRTPPNWEDTSQSQVDHAMVSNGMAMIKAKLNVPNLQYRSPGMRQTNAAVPRISVLGAN